MPHTLIESNPTFKRPGSFPKEGVLKVAEFFSDTIQGEGISAGVPSTFLRLQGCTLDCVWCDTATVWREGNPYYFKELFLKIRDHSLHERLKNGQHLILTGGSPLKQQDNLIAFIEGYMQEFHHKPFIEVENECVLSPHSDLVHLVDQWNNSPKLENSGMKRRVRYKPEILAQTAKLKNSWFKFVVQNDLDWEEIQKDFIDTKLISRSQVILMPCGEDQKLLDYTRPIVAEMAAKHSVRFTDRLHVTIWNKKTGV